MEDRVESDGIGARRLKLAVMGDPVVRAIVELLSLQPATAGEIAAETAVPVETVRRHLRRLSRYGLVEKRGRTRRRGFTENLYGCDLRRTILWSGETSDLPGQKVDEADLRLLRTLFHEATEAIEAGTFGARPESVVIRFSLPLDAGGLRQAAVIHDELLDSIITVVATAKDRLAEGAEEPIEACAALLFFETPDWGIPEPGGDREMAPVTPRRASNRNHLDTLVTIAGPVRGSIIDALSLGAASSGELADRVGMPVERVRYELRYLQRAGAIKVHGHRPRRGTLEKVYICENRNLVMSTEDVATDAGGSLDRYRRTAVAAILRRSLGAMRSGATNSADSHLSRVPMRVDAQAFAEISELMGAALERLFALREQCLERSATEGSELRPAVSGLLLFERPPSH